MDTDTGKRCLDLTIMLLFASLAAFMAFGCGDDDTGTDPNNHAPNILSITAEPDTFHAGDSTVITVTAEDPDGDGLHYAWDTHETWMIALPGSGNPLVLSNCCPITELRSGYVVAIVTDGRGGGARDSIQIWILPPRR